MKKIIIILTFILNFQIYSYANDIKEFELEGISVGDNLLNHYDKDLIQNIEKFYYPGSKKYAGIASNMFSKNLKNFEAIQFMVNPDTYKIVSVAGKIYKYNNDLDGCYKEMDEIFEDIKLIFPNSKTEKEKASPHMYDKSEKSIAKVYKILLKNGRIAITCTDWSDEVKLRDSLKVAIHMKKYMDWINNEAY